VARKQLGMVDEGLVDRVDERCQRLGQTRRTFIERALERHIAYVDEVDERHRGAGDLAHAGNPDEKVR
jgi:metal-responsive CopG/Arc/MetJ family transcriptional regulator